MTRNLTGGKNHKKAKQYSEKAKFIEKQDDQLYARVVKMLGNRNVLTFCNDNKLRLCHIRGSIRKDMWINEGDIVIISVRDFLTEKDGKYDKGDILFKYDRENHARLRKDSKINIKLFLHLEKMDVESLEKIGESAITELKEEDDDLFEDSAEEVESEASIDIDNI